MRKTVLTVILSVAALSLASFAVSQETDLQSCQKTLQNNCASCHGLNKVCAKLDEGGADWKKIVANMGKKGSISQDVQDSVVACLTKSSDPKKVACGK